MSASTGRGAVKTVLSGDTIVLYGRSSSGPPPEREITLSHVSAPRLGRSGERKDEPFAWQSREFLRKNLIGKIVNFRIDYTNPAIKREFGTITLDDVNYNKQSVAQGWCRVRTLGAKDVENEDYPELQRLEQQAQAAEKGIWSKDTSNAVRNVLFPGQYDQAEVFARIKGKSINGVVEQVRDGSTLRITLPPTFDDNYYSIMLHLTGISCPTIKRISEEGKEETGEKAEVKLEAQPFALEAKFFTECRLLNREVKINFEMADKYDNFFGTVTVPQGNISEELLKQGLAKIADWSIAQAQNPDKLRAAERAAKEQKLRLFKDYKPQSIQGEKEFTGQVVEVPSGDMITVHVDGVDKRITLASIRAPRQGKRGEAGEPYSAEARETMRKKIIGQKVKVKVDFVKAAPELNPPTRTFASVYLPDNTNIAEFIVRSGYAKVMRPSQDAEDQRSRHYDALQSAETLAQKEGLGIHSKGEAPKHQINDLSQYGKGLLQKARTVLPFFQRGGKMQGIVEHVINGARFVIYVPRENVLVLFGLVGVRCPKPASKEGPGEPYGDESLRYTRLNVLHRNVELDVENVDKTGTFIGRMFVNKKDYSPQILRDGLARVFSSGRPLSDLLAAEKEARTAKTGLWATYDESQDQEPSGADEDDLPRSTQRELMNITVSEIVDGAHFYGRIVEENDEMDAAINLACASLLDTPSTFTPDIGMIVAAKFSVDERWYRARVLEKVSGGGYNVLFIDWGNREFVPLARLRPLPSHLASQKPQAQKFALSFIHVPSQEEEFGTESAQLFKTLAWGKNLVASVDWRATDGTICATVYDPDSHVVLNEAMLREGLGLIQKGHDRRYNDVIAKLKQHQDVGRSKLRYLWRYGDAYEDSDDDAPEFGYRAPVGKAVGGKGAPAAPAKGGRR